MNAIFLFFQNYKKIILGVLAGLLLIVFLSMSVAIFYYKQKAVSIENKYQKQEIKQKEEQLKQYEHVMAEISAHNARLKVILSDTSKMNEQIKNLKIEGKCIKDETYYNTARDIINRHNSVL